VGWPARPGCKSFVGIVAEFVLAFAIAQLLGIRLRLGTHRSAKANNMPEDLPSNTGPANVPVKRRANAPLGWGFLLALVAFLSYIPIFAKYPFTRDVPWANFLLFALGFVLLFIGLRRAFAQPPVYKGKIAGPILAIISVAALVFFCFTIFSLGKHLPLSTQAPKVGQKAPDFSLADANGATVSLASLLSTQDASHPIKGVVLIFYRGYW
jgi:uncharacterized membrane protein